MTKQNNIVDNDSSEIKASANRVNLPEEEAIKVVDEIRDGLKMNNHRGGENE